MFWGAFGSLADVVSVVVFNFSFFVSGGPVELFVVLVPRLVWSSVSSYTLRP